MLSPDHLMWTRICAGIALFLVANFAYALWKARRGSASSKSWPTVPGAITASAVKVPRALTSDEDTDCSVEIRYSYRVGAKDYEGKRIHSGRDAMTTRLIAEEVTAKYPVGSHVDVHYRPDRPGTAVLEPRDTANLAALIAFLVVFSCIAGVLIVHSIAGKVIYLHEGGVPLFAFLLPLAAITVGVGGVYDFLRMRRTLSESARWPQAAGTITTSDVVAFQDTERDSDDRERSVTKYRAAIRFAYQVGAREFHSSRWSWGWTAIYGTPEGAQKIVDAHPKGKAVPVFYDPKQPESAVLEPANRQGTLAPLIFGLVFGLTGALMFWAFTEF
jgi:Protein of unknown function (DUF3592)